MVLLDVESPQTPLVRVTLSKRQVGFPLGGRAVNSPLDKGGWGGFGVRYVCLTAHSLVLLTMLLQDRLNMGDHIINVESVLIQNNLAGSRSAEPIHADDANVRANIGLPSQW